MPYTGMDDVLAYLDGISEETVELEFCRRFNQDSDIWIFERHTHSHMELIYFLEGTARIDTLEEPIEVSLFDVLVHPPQVSHKESVDTRLRQEVICIGLTVESEVRMDRSFVLNDPKGTIYWICKQIHGEIQRPRRRDEALLRQLLRMLVLYMRHNLRYETQLERQIPNKSLLYIQEHFMERITVEDMARTAQVSSSYFSRIFREEVGMPPMKYVNTLRVEMAQRLLKSSMTIQEVAGAVGFDDAKYFSKAFKKMTGFSPSVYREAQRSGPEEPPEKGGPHEAEDGTH